MTLEPTGADAGNTPAAVPSLPSGAPAATPGTQSVSLPSGQASGAPTPAPAAAPAAPVTQAEQAAAAGMTVEAWKAMPKSWKKEMQAEWDTAGDGVRKYVHEREQQAFRGIQMYAKGHEAWSKLTEPYQELLSQNPDVNPMELMSALAHNHFILTRGTPEQKRGLYKAMAQHYGITQEEARQAANGDPNPASANGPFTPEQMAALQQILGPVVQPVQQMQQRDRAAKIAEAESSVDAFFSDPQNEFAEDVGQDMLEVLKKGQAGNLQEAYEIAIMRNPEVKAKYLAKLSAAAGKTPAAPPLNVQSSTTPATPPTPGTMDETIRAITKKHYG